MWHWYFKTRDTGILKIKDHQKAKTKQGHLQQIKTESLFYIKSFNKIHPPPAKKQDKTKPMDLMRLKTRNGSWSYNLISLLHPERPVLSTHVNSHSTPHVSDIHYMSPACQAPSKLFVQPQWGKASALSGRQSKVKQVNSKQTASGRLWHSGGNHRAQGRRATQPLHTGLERGLEMHRQRQLVQMTPESSDGGGRVWRAVPLNMREDTTTWKVPDTAGEGFGDGGLGDSRCQGVNCSSHSKTGGRLLPGKMGSRAWSYLPSRNHQQNHTHLFPRVTYSHQNKPTYGEETAWR